jgi:hypothetical protein
MKTIDQADVGHLEPKCTGSAEQADGAFLSPWR